MSVTDESSEEVKIATLAAEVKALREKAAENVVTRDKALQEIKETLAGMQRSIDQIKSKPTNWSQIGIVIAFLSLIFGAYVYPIKKDIDDNRKALDRYAEMSKRDIDDVAKIVNNNREMGAKDLAMMRSDFEAVKRENVWNWDGMKTRLDNLTKQLDLMWKKVFGEIDKK